MEWIADPSIWAGLITLIVIELVLGIDNLVFIAILAEKLPPKQRDRARVTGLLLAMLMRLLLLASISWLVTLTQPLFSFRSFTFSARDLIMLFGGFFLLFKATMELNERLEGKDSNNPTQRKGAKFWGVVTQIVVLDAIFSLDSVITAVGMVDHLLVMMAAVVIAISLIGNPFHSKYKTYSLYDKCHNSIMDKSGQKCNVAALFISYYLRVITSHYP
jgi:predicted tellurium resistance membrane protein TerC